MNEEEKKAIEDIKRELSDEDKKEYMSSWFAKDLDIAVNLIEKLQKENEEYKKAIDVVNKEKADWIKAYQEEKDKQFDLINKISSNDFIQKQKVKDRIEKLKNNPLKIKQNDKYYYETDAYNKIVVQVLQELLEGRK